MKVINFEPKYYKELLAFSKKIWPQKSEEYLRYKLFQIPEKEEDNRCNLIVLNDDGAIIGCNFFFPTKAKINGREEKILWSHDTVVDKEFRGDAGMLLMLETASIKSTIGLGISDINLKIQRKLKANFIGMVYQYFIFNFWSYKLLFNKFRYYQGQELSTYYFPDEISVVKRKFKKIFGSSELNIPNGGYWGDGALNMDLIRDEHFLKKRFFENFNTYYFYKLLMDDSIEKDECYFVVRPIIKWNYVILSLIDFRFNLNKKNQFDLIIKACIKICRKNKLPLIIFRDSNKFKKLRIYPKIFRRNFQSHILTNLTLNQTSKILITQADSDIDFRAQKYEAAN